jgi:hypothetical protein
MQRLTLGTWLRPLWRRRRLPAAMDGWYDSRLPNGIWVRYRVQGGWIVTAYATAGDDPGDSLLAMWGEPEVVTTYRHRPRGKPQAAPSIVSVAIDRLLGRSKER